MRFFLLLQKITLTICYTTNRYTWLTKTIEINDYLQHTSKVVSVVGQTCFFLLNIFSSITSLHFINLQINNKNSIVLTTMFE